MSPPSKVKPTAWSRGSETIPSCLDGVLTVIASPTSFQQNGDQRQVASKCRDLRWHFTLGIPANGRQLNTPITEPGRPVREIGQQLIGHEDFSEDGDV